MALLYPHQTGDVVEEEPVQDVSRKNAGHAGLEAVLRQLSICATWMKD